MSCCKIIGGSSVHGKVSINGSKNAALPILAATLLTGERCILHNVPDLTDVACVLEALKLLGAEVTQLQHDSWSIEAKQITSDARDPIVSRLRASICLLGALLGRKHQAAVALPGGCKLGERPIDLHLRTFEALGAKITTNKDSVIASADRLIGSEFSMLGKFGPTVTGTSNAILASVLAEGTTIIHHAAQEPEIIALCQLLNQMGAKINGIGSDTLTIEGVDQLHGTEFSISQDRIEAGTFIILGLLCGEPVTIDNLSPEFVTQNFPGFFESIPNAKKHCSWDGNLFHISKINDLPAFDIRTAPFPGFPTDLQPQISILASQAHGNCCICDTVFPQRFAHAPEFKKLGIKIHQHDNVLEIAGPCKLTGTNVVATDLRAAAALYLAGIIASGETTVHCADYIDRGYENFEARLSQLGVKIQRCSDENA